MSDKDLQIESAVTESVEEEVENEVTEIENEDDQNGDDAPEAVNDKKKVGPELEKIKATRSALEKFARDMKQQKDYLIPMKKIRDDYEAAVAEGKVKRVDTGTLDHFLDVQLQAIENSISMGKELEQLLPPEEKKAVNPPSKKKAGEKKETKVSKKQAEKVEVPISKLEDPKMTKKQVEKAEKEEQFISLFDF